MPHNAKRLIEAEQLSLAGRLVASLAVPTLRKRRRFQSPEALSRFIEMDRARGPALPPKKLHRRFAVEERIQHGMRVFTVRPLGTKDGATILYLPGGGYVFQPVPPHWTLVAGLVESSGATVVFPIYPLAPEHDAEQGFAALTALYLDLNGSRNGDPLFIGGDSAGGGLALSLAQQWRDQGIRLPEGLILFAPFADGTVSEPQQAAIEPYDHILTINGARDAAMRWSGALSPRDPRISPLFGSLKGVPPMLLIVGSHDILAADAERLFAKALEEDVEMELRIYPGMFHVFMAVSIPEGRRALKQAGQFVSRISKRGGF